MIGNDAARVLLSEVHNGIYYVTHCPS